MRSWCKQAVHEDRNRASGKCTRCPRPRSLHSKNLCTLHKRVSPMLGKLAIGAKQFRPRYETTFQTVAFLHTYPKSWLWAPARALATGERIANPKGSQPPQSIIICDIVVGGIAFQGEALMRFCSASSAGSHGTCWGKIPRTRSDRKTGGGLCETLLDLRVLPRGNCFPCHAFAMTLLREYPAL